MSIDFVFLLRHSFILKLNQRNFDIFHLKLENMVFGLNKFHFSIFNKNFRRDYLSILFLNNGLKFRLKFRFDFLNFEKLMKIGKYWNNLRKKLEFF